MQSQQTQNCARNMPKINTATISGLIASIVTALFVAGCSSTSMQNEAGRSPKAPAKIARKRLQSSKFKDYDSKSNINGYSSSFNANVRELKKPLPDLEEIRQTKRKPPISPAVLSAEPYSAEAVRRRFQRRPKLSLPDKLQLASSGTLPKGKLVVACLALEGDRIIDRRSRAIAGALRRGAAYTKTFALDRFLEDQSLKSALRFARQRGASVLALCLGGKERSLLIFDADGGKILARVRNKRRELAEPSPFLNGLVDRLSRVWGAD